jgi:hypothetical protein
MIGVYKGGWIDMPEQVEAILPTQPFPYFCDTPCGSDDVKIPERIMGWEMAVKVLGHNIPQKNQGQYGTCTSFAGAYATEMTMIAEIYAGQSEEYKPLSTEAIYGFGRVEVGGGRIKCMSDGSNGIWTVEGLKKYGTIARGVYGKYDLSKYSGALSREWGCKGIPEEIEKECLFHKIGAYSQVKTLLDVDRALASGYFIIVCSSVGFNKVRKDGVATPGPRWDHAMSCLGKNKDLYLIQNSWGDFFSGTKGDLPDDSCFYVEGKVLERMLAANDSYAVSNYEGFKTRELDWYI